jgi:hypothetical protein
MSKHAKLRVCASCEWIYKTPDPFQPCPKCNFVSYGARYVYGDKCYSFLKNQKPWFDKKILDYQIKLEKEIRDVKRDASLQEWS